MYVRLTVIASLTAVALSTCAVDARAQDLGGQDVRPATEYVHWTVGASPILDW